ncbi:ImpA family type VI secretion system protein [Microbulbifer taiwanensis]|uniref:type VI secretion system protein TssA n=1 Tax=Microbulbifer taiwanensis TaxID=986746 RepID=UPI003620B12A
MNAASNEWARDLVETIEDAINHYKSINDALRSSCGHDAPPSTNISALLDEVLRTARFVFKSQLDALVAAEASAEADAPSAAESETAAGAVPAAAPGVAVAAGPVSSREGALKLLEEAAKYFRTYEPHTPLAPGLERLIGWGRMTVSELMTELLPDEQSRAVYSQLTGVRLDGSDTQRYVAPPVVTSAPAPSAVAQTENASEAAAPQSEWNEEPQAEASVGW